MKFDTHDGDDGSDDHGDNDEHQQRDFGLRKGLFELARLLRWLEESEGSRGVGRIEGTGSSVHYDASVTAGIGTGDGPGRISFPRRYGRDRRAPPGKYHITHHEEGGEVVVIGDLPGVSAEDLTVGFENFGEVLVVAVGGEVVERVSLPWPGRTEQSSYKNGVLEIRLREDA